MTVAELIKQLKQFPPDTRIVVRGYEDGFNDILKLLPVKIKLNVNEHWYEGAHEKNNDLDAVDAIELFGENEIANDD